MIIDGICRCDSAVIALLSLIFDVDFIVFELVALQLGPMPFQLSTLTFARLKQGHDNMEEASFALFVCV